MGDTGAPAGDTVSRWREASRSLSRWGGTLAVSGLLGFVGGLMARGTPGCGPRIPGGAYTAWLPPCWLHGLWRALAPSPLLQLCTVLLPLVLLLVFAPRRRRRVATGPAQGGWTAMLALCHRSFCWLCPPSACALLGLRRPFTAPCLTQIYVLSLPVAQLTAGRWVAFWESGAFSSYGVASRAAWGFACAVWALAVLIAEVRYRMTRGPDAQPAPEAPAKNRAPAEMLAGWRASKPAFDVWLQDDSPAAEGAFDLPDYAAQLHQDLVAQRSGGALDGIRLIGPRGIGKTTIAGQLAEAWERDRGHIFVRIDAWAYESGADLAAGLIRVLSERVGELDALVVLARHERSFLRLAGYARSWLPHALRLMLGQRATTPLDVIERFNRDLERLGVWLVFWLDDLDRFLELDQTAELKLGKRTHQLRSRTGADARIVDATLHALVSQPRLGFICALSDWDAGMLRDPEKLFADDREIRALSLDAWRPVVSIFRTHYQEPFGGRVTPAQRQTRTFFDALWDKKYDAEADSETSEPEWHEAFKYFSEALANTSITPRQLKRVLQVTRKRHRPVAKIVELDELLMLYLLRQTEGSSATGDYEALRTVLAGTPEEHDFYASLKIASSKKEDMQQEIATVFEEAMWKLESISAEDPVHHQLLRALCRWLLFKPRPWAHLRSLATDAIRQAIFAEIDFVVESRIASIINIIRVLEDYLRAGSPTDASALAVSQFLNASDAAERDYASRYAEALRPSLSKGQKLKIIRLQLQRARKEAKGKNWRAFSLRIRSIQSIDGFLNEALQNDAQWLVDLMLPDNSGCLIALNDLVVIFVSIATCYLRVHVDPYDAAPVDVVEGWEHFVEYFCLKLSKAEGHLQQGKVQSDTLVALQHAIRSPLPKEEGTVEHKWTPSAKAAFAHVTRRVARIANRGYEGALVHLVSTGKFHNKYPHDLYDLNPEWQKELADSIMEDAEDEATALARAQEIARVYFSQDAGEVEKDALNGFDKSFPRMEAKWQGSLKAKESRDL